MKTTTLIIVTLLTEIALARNFVVEDNAATRGLLPDVVYECEARAIERIRNQAEAMGVEVDMQTLRISKAQIGVPASFIQWTVDVVDIKGRTDLFPAGTLRIISKMTQKPFNSSCF